jgi:EAL domain-containing protein (putative c-di-GMP-specific phosphodiesterase class I)
LVDVGAGRNSLETVESYLEYIDQIKFSLIKYESKVVEDETIQLFLRSWNSFAKKNHLELIVEGIENKQTMIFLKSHGIYLQQGYFFGKPCKYINYYTHYMPILKNKS